MGFELTPRRVALLGCLVLALSVRSEARADGTHEPPRDQVYRYRTAEGREVFTNAGRVSVGGQALKPLDLPELRVGDLSGASPSQLRDLDRGVQQAHDALQSGERCEAIRASSRTSPREYLMRGHLRELAVGGALIAAALLVFATWIGRLRGLMPLAPLLASLYLGHVTYARIERHQTVLRDGLRACSSDLPASEASSSESVHARLETAVSLQSTIDRAYQEQARAIERAHRER